MEEYASLLSLDFDHGILIRFSDIKFLKMLEESNYTYLQNISIDLVLETLLV